MSFGPTTIYPSRTAYTTVILSGRVAERGQVLVRRRVPHFWRLLPEVGISHALQSKATAAAFLCHCERRVSASGRKSKNPYPNALRLTPLFSRL